MSGTLFVVATPIGNLGDITFRAIETLKSVDLILCEDTRVTGKLLHHFGIEKTTTSYHEHSDAKKTADILKTLSEGKNIALVTDAGTPGISDPGNKLIEQITRYKKQETNDITVVSVPGVSAVTAALSVSGFPTDKFIFLGFPPHKNKRKKFFQEIADAKYTVVFYESSHRIKKALAELAEVLDQNRELCVCRELTKQFESIYRGTIEEIVKMDIPERGEFVVVVC